MRTNLPSVVTSLALLAAVGCDPDPKPEPDPYVPTCEDGPVAPAGDADPILGEDGASFSAEPETAIADDDAWAMSPHVAVASDGSAWISWFSWEDAGMSMRVQRLDASGAPTFDAAGLELSLDPEQSWVMDHQLLVTEDGAAIVVYTDTRSGVWDVVAVAVSPDGALPWGEPQSLSGGDLGYDGTPSAALLADGDLIVTWAHSPEGEDEASAVRLQRLSADGQLRWPDPIELDCEAGTCESPVVAPIEGSDVGVAWLESVGSMTDDRDVFATRLDADGCAVWDAPVQLDGEDGVPYYKDLSLAHDEQGLIVGWSALSADGGLSALIQRVGDDGAVAWDEGLALSTSLDRLGDTPVLGVDPSTGDVLAIWSEANQAQTRFGLRAQRISPEGQRLWDGEGLELVALGQMNSDPAGARAWGDQAVLVYEDSPIDEDAGFYGYQTRVNLATVDADGALSTQVLSDEPSAKLKVRVSETSAYGAWTTVWADERQDSGDIFAATVVASAPASAR